IAGRPHGPLAPHAWTDWIQSGRYRPLKATRSIEYRTRNEQRPSSTESLKIVDHAQTYFAGRPHDFEECAGAIARLLVPGISELGGPRPSRDGGRDAVGTLRLGRGSASILVDFALEAKCYGLGNSVGVREMSRLISRLRHRQFGVLVT